MRFTAPHYGNSAYAVKILFDGLKIPFLLPERTDKRSLELGLKYAPEDVCQPFKLMLGDYIKSIEAGADTLLLLATNGPCRLGEYAHLQVKLIEKAGYQADHIILYTANGFKALKQGVKQILVHSPVGLLRKYLALYRCLRGLFLMDRIEAALRYRSGYEMHAGDCKKLLRECFATLEKTQSPHHSIRMLKSYWRRAKRVPISPYKDPLKVALIGEIYTISDPFSSRFVEDRLMDQGISVRRSLTPSWWVKDTLMKPFKLNSRAVNKAAKAYIHECHGGYTKETVGKSLVSEEQGLDGAIQIFPVSCTPEIIAKPILENVSREKDFPILTLVIDEMTGDEGFLTRIEAFTDMLERRKKTCI